MCCTMPSGKETEASTASSETAVEAAATGVRWYTAPDISATAAAARGVCGPVAPGTAVAAAAATGVCSETAAGEAVGAATAARGLRCARSDEAVAARGVYIEAAAARGVHSPSALGVARCVHAMPTEAPLREGGDRVARPARAAAAGPNAAIGNGSSGVGLAVVQLPVVSGEAPRERRVAMPRVRSDRGDSPRQVHSAPSRAAPPGGLLLPDGS